jgi:hypothetical protein
VGPSLFDLGDADHVFTACKTGISEFCVLMQVDCEPETKGLLLELHVLSFTLAIVKEVTVATLIELFSQKENQLRAELKLAWELMPQLVQAVKELEEDLAEVAVVGL